MSEEQEPITNFDGKSTSDHQILLIAITIATLFLAMYGKFITIGWLTIILIWSFILPAHFILFTGTGIKLAIRKNKTKGDYIYFFALCITMLLYAFTFVDMGDTSTNTAIDFIGENILSKISFISFCTNLVLIFINSRRLK